MHQIIYSSQAKSSVTFPTLVALLMQARALNERHHITGALVYGNGQFIQVIEGEEMAVRALYERITHDTRHCEVRKLTDTAIENRSFAQWSMAFGEVPASVFQKLIRVTGYQTPVELAQRISADTQPTKLLLDKLLEIVQIHKQQ